MRLTLVNPPSGFRDRLDLAPPLGLLTLAAVVDRDPSWSVQVLDFNLEVMKQSAPEACNFYNWAVGRILSTAPDVVGFTSMCLESHVALELATRIKKSSPGILTIFGGTHFGSISVKLVEGFPAVDYVIEGEGEFALGELLVLLSEGGSPLGLPANVVFRYEGRPTRGKSSNCFLALEEIPYPALGCIDLDSYFALNPRRLLLYEGGRGCVFSCSFCYSPVHYGHSVRSKDPSMIVADLRRLADAGAEHIFFVQDNVLNSIEWAHALCEVIAAAKLPLTWSCYATLPQLSSDLVMALANAKCTGIFLGIDATVPEMQRRFRKRFFSSWVEVLGKLRYCISQGITPTCAFILDFEKRRGTAFEDTVRCALECKELGCDVHLNTLAVYNGTDLDEGYKSSAAGIYSTRKVELLLDVPPVVIGNSLALVHPDLFPYHLGREPLSEWEGFVAKVFCLFAAIYALPLSMRLWIEKGGSVDDLLSEVDKDFCDFLVGLEPHERREAALRRVSARILSRMSGEDRKVLVHEIARLVLSFRDSIQVLVSVEGSRCDAVLRPFLRLDGDEVRSFGGGGFFPDQGETATREFALRIADRVKILRVSQDLACLIENISGTAKQGASVEICREVYAFLQDSGWIAILGNAEGIAD